MVADEPGALLRDLRERAGMSVEQVAEAAGVEPAWLVALEAGMGAEELTYQQICALVQATQPPRPEWWDEGYEHDLGLWPHAVTAESRARRPSYWAQIEQVRVKIARRYGDEADCADGIEREPAG